MYAEHFGFSKLPFSVTPGPQEVFNNSLYREAFAKLRYGVLAKKGFVLITGEVGTGKTTLLPQLLHSLGPTVHCVFISNTQVSFVELLRSILDDLNLARENDDKLAMIEILNQYLIERLRQGHIVTLLIDEAQNLSDEALEGLRLLSNLKTNNEKLLQIVLMGRPELEIKLDHPKLRQLKQRISIQCRLAPLKKEEVGAYIEFRLNAAGYLGESLFHRASLDAIAFYSKGIPRLVNIICDNALLAAYAASKREVSAQMVEDVARDLRLGPPRPIEAGHPVIHKMPDNPVRPRMKEDRLPEFENVFVGAGKEHRPELQRQCSLSGLGVGVFVGAVLLGGIAVFYSQQSKIYLSDLTTSWENVSRESKDYLSDRAVKVKDVFERTEEYMVDAAVKAGDLSQPLFGKPAPVAERPPLISQELKEPKRDEKAHLAAATTAETQIAKNTEPPTTNRTVSDSPEAQRTESHQLASLKPEPGPLELSNEGQARFSGNFEVVENSFVRDTPQSDAEIITTLQRGTLVRVESKTGKYLRVHSMNDPGVHGYVHEEDAFFKPIKSFQFGSAR
ncbi:MAG: AAA family ATPase [Alphaproteobacteria bacterium]